MSFKAIELDAATRQRTGREHQLDCGTRQEALDELLRILAVKDARVDPSRTLVEVEGALWTLVAARPPVDDVNSSLRRAGAKHKRVR